MYRVVLSGGRMCDVQRTSHSVSGNTFPSPSSCSTFTTPPHTSFARLVTSISCTTPLPASASGTGTSNMA